MIRYSVPLSFAPRFVSLSNSAPEKQRRNVARTWITSNKRILRHLRLLEAFFEKNRLAVYLFLCVFRVQAIEGAVGAEFPTVRVVGELEVKQAADLLAVALLAQREGRLDATVEVALHQVGASEVHLFVIPVGKGEDTGVLEEASYQRDYADVLAHGFHAGPEAADAAYDQVYLHPGLGGFVEELDDLRVGERVGLARDAGGLAVFGPLGLLLDKAHYALAHGQRGDEQLLVLLLLGVAGQVVEEVRAVLGELRVVGEVREVRVDAGRHRVVVSCAEVDVASEPRALAPDDQADLGVSFEADDTVGDVDAPGLELARPGDIRFFVEARFKLDQDGDLRLLVARLRERLDYRGVRADTVEGLLYG